MEASEEKPLFTKELNENLDNDQLQISPLIPVFFESPAERSHYMQTGQHRYHCESPCLFF